MSGDAFLTLDGVSVDLNRRTVVRDVSVELPRRCLVALVGPNGAGKTTLLRAVAGLLPSRGVIRLGRRDVAALSSHERALAFAFCRKAISCIGRCRRAISWRSAASRTARSIPTGCDPPTPRPSNGPCRPLIRSPSPTGPRPALRRRAGAGGAGAGVGGRSPCDSRRRGPRPRAIRITDSPS